MSLNSIINTATSGLLASQAAISVLSDNVANAGVANYTAKSLDITTFQAGAESGGVRIGAVTRSVDAAVQASLLSANSNVAGLTIRSQALQAVNATQGQPGDGTSLADALSSLQASFTNLLGQPSDPTLQAATVAAAGNLANTITNTANAVTSQRNAAEQQIAATVNTVNDALAEVQQSTVAIKQALAGGQSTATLEDQRDAALNTLSGALNLSYVKQDNGDITILGNNGLSIPLSARLSTQAVTLSPGSFYAPGGGNIPPIQLISSNPGTAPVDVTSQLSGGQLGALITLRDNTLPAYTAELDEFSQKLASRFQQQGLTLFTDAAGNVPDDTAAPNPANYVGFSSQIQVNPAVLASPSTVRDGTPGIPAGAQLPQGSPFPVNPANGPAGFSDLINRVLTYTFGANMDANNPNLAFAATGLGPAVTLSANIGASSTLATYAQNFVSAQSADTAQASNDLTNAQSYQTAMSSRFSDESGVDVDQEMGLMIQLQNSYQANARILQTSQTLFTALLNAFTPTA